MTTVEMNAEQYDYDVAFSFLAGDESLATQLNDLLQDRLKTFLFSKRQGEIAGTDGEKSFGAVFDEKSRLVVVPYRGRFPEAVRLKDNGVLMVVTTVGYSPRPDHAMVRLVLHVVRPAA